MVVENLAIYAVAFVVEKMPANALESPNKVCRH